MRPLLWVLAVFIAFAAILEDATACRDQATRAAYTYYAGNQRATGVVDSDLDAGAVPDQRTHFFYDAKWQLIEERVDAGYSGGWGWSDANFVTAFDTGQALLRQYIWCPHDLDRLIGFMFSTTPGGEQLPYRYAALTDRSRSVLGLQRVSEHAPASRTRYSVYGVPEVQRPGDVSGDGLVDNADRALINAAMNEELGEAAYNADADLNHDGTVDSADLSLWSSYRFDPPPAVNAVSLLNSVIGYAGAVHDPATGLILMRHRWYDPHLGRFITRDPAGYVDGMSLYWYATGNPVMLVDPMGLTAAVAWAWAKDYYKGLGNIAKDTVVGTVSLGKEIGMATAYTVGEAASRVTGRDLRMVSGESLYNNSTAMAPLAHSIEEHGATQTAINMVEGTVESVANTVEGIARNDPRAMAEGGIALSTAFVGGVGATKSILNLTKRTAPDLPTSPAPDALLPEPTVSASNVSDSVARRAANRPDVATEPSRVNSSGRYSDVASNHGAFWDSGQNVFPTRRNSGLRGTDLRNAQYEFALRRLQVGADPGVIRGQAQSAGLTRYNNSGVDRLADPGAENMVLRAIRESANKDCP